MSVVLFGFLCFVRLRRRLCEYEKAKSGCQFAQQDADGNFAGDACSVPEPGFGLGLLIGGSALAGISARRRRSRAV